MGARRQGWVARLRVGFNKGGQWAAHVFNDFEPNTHPNVMAVDALTGHRLKNGHGKSVTVDFDHLTCSFVRFCAIWRHDCAQ
jgi:hypothetical protein